VYEYIEQTRFTEAYKSGDKGYGNRKTNQEAGELINYDKRLALILNIVS
jgi:hypothetical protein